MSWFVLALQRFAVFSGRSQRAEYWYFVLFYLLIYVLAIAVDTTLGTSLISLAFSLAMIIPYVAVGVRRLHDTGRSGWWLLIGLIPLVNFVLLVFLTQDSDSQANEYGPNPKLTPAMAGDIAHL